MAVRAVRGATQLEEDVREHLLERVAEMVGDVMESNGLDVDDFAPRLSFFWAIGMNFYLEIAKMRAFVDLWDEICETRYGVTDPKYRRFRYGVQVNSLGLTEQQPENNVYRILIEMLAVTLSKKARARAVQLPAWNEALGLPRPWDQQWSLRMQQILAYETDLLEYDDLFDGNPAIDRKVEALKDGARAELAQIDAMGGAVAAIDYMKGRLVEANAERIAHHFRSDRLEDILASLEADDSEWAMKELATLHTKSPQTCKVALRQLAEAAQLTDFADEMRMEYRIASRVLTRPDFAEGVRAVIVDKTNDPKWNPATPEGVSEDLIDSIFAPLPAEEEWKPL